MPDQWDKFVEQPSGDKWDQYAEPAKPGFWQSMAESTGVPQAARDFKPPSTLPELARSAWEDSPWGTGVRMVKDAAQTIYRGVSKAGEDIRQGNYGKAVGTDYPSAVPFFGPMAQRVGEQAREGNWTGAAGTAVGAVAQAALPELFKRGSVAKRELPPPPESSAPAQPTSVESVATPVAEVAPAPAPAASSVPYRPWRSEPITRPPVFGETPEWPYGNAQRPQATSEAQPTPVFENQNQWPYVQPKERVAPAPEPEPEPASAEPEPEPQKSTRLYRVDPGPIQGPPVPDWAKSDPRYIASQAATGRWFTADQGNLDFYLRDAGPGAKVSYVDVPSNQLESFRVSNQPTDVSRFSADPENEFFLPRELADQRQPVAEPDQMLPEVANKPAPDLPAPVASGKRSDISPFRAMTIGSPDIMLKEIGPEGEELVDKFLSNHDGWLSHLAQSEREFLEPAKGLSSREKDMLGELLQAPDPRTMTGQISETTGLPFSPDLTNRAYQARQLLEQKFNDTDQTLNMLDITAGRKPREIGHIEGYFPRLQRMTNGNTDLARAVNSIWQDSVVGPARAAREFFTGKAPEGPLDEGSSTQGMMYGQNQPGTPQSRFLKTRTGALTDYELNYDRVIPAYLRSLNHIVSRQMAIDQISPLIDQIPADLPKAKALAQKWLTAYVRGDGGDPLTRAMNRGVDALSSAVSVPVMSFRPQTTLYHAGQFITQTAPSLLRAGEFPNINSLSSAIGDLYGGTRYLRKGLQDFFAHPQQTIQEANAVGAIPNNITPWDFKTFGQKARDVGTYLNAAFAFDRSVGYRGFYQQALDQGMSEEQAQIWAVNKTKDATAIPDEARMPLAANALGPASRLARKWTQIPSRAIDQLYSITKRVKQDPRQFALTYAGYMMAAAAATGGVKIAHFAPDLLVPAGGAIADYYRRAIDDLLIKGDVDKFLTDVIGQSGPVKALELGANVLGAAASIGQGQPQTTPMGMTPDQMNALAAEYQKKYGNLLNTDKAKALMEQKAAP